MTLKKQLMSLERQLMCVSTHDDYLGGDAILATTYREKILKVSADSLKSTGLVLSEWQDLWSKVS